MPDITLRKEIILILARSRKEYLKIICATAIMLLLAAAYILLRQPHFTANASVMIAGDRSIGGAAMNLVKQFSLGNILGGSGSVHDELSMLSSHTTLMGAVKAVGANTTYTIRESFMSRRNIYTSTPVRLEYNPSIPDTLTAAITFKLSVDSRGMARIKARKGFHTIGETTGTLPLTLETTFGDFTFLPADSILPSPLKMTIRTTGYSRAAEELDHQLNIEIPNKLADVVSLSYESDNPLLATDMLHAIIDKYNQRGIEAKRIRDTQTLSFIDNRLALLTGELSGSEKDVETFKQENRLTDLRAESEYMLGERITVDQELLKAETNAGILRLTKDFIDDPANSGNFIPVLGLGASDTEAVTAYNDLIMQRINLEKSAKPGNPVLERLNAQIDGMRNAVKKSVERSLENALVAVDRLSAKNRATNARIEAVPAQEHTFRDIMRRQTVQEQLMIFLMEQREETSLNMVSTLGRGEIVNEPYILTLDTESSPLTILAAAFIIGLLLFPVKWYFTSLLKS